MVQAIITTSKQANQAGGQSELKTNASFFSNEHSSSCDMTELAGLVHDGEVVAHSKWCGGWCVCPRWQSSHCRRHHHTVRASAKEKKGWSAIAGAQLDWEHRKIREKGVSVKAELLWAQSIAKRVDCMRDRGKPTQHSAPWHIALSTHFSYFRLFKS